MKLTERYVLLNWRKRRFFLILPRPDYKASVRAYHLGAPTVGIQNGAVGGDGELDIGVAMVPDADFLHIGGGDSLLLDIGPERADGFQKPQILALFRAIHPFHQIIPQDLQRKTQGDGRHGRQQQHGQQLQTQPAVGLTFSQIDTPFPRWSGSVWDWWGPPPAFSAGSGCGP